MVCEVGWPVVADIVLSGCESIVESPLRDLREFSRRRRRWIVSDCGAMRASRQPKGQRKSNEA
jgi:hypothetical protein